MPEEIASLLEQAKSTATALFSDRLGTPDDIYQNLMDLKDHIDDLLDSVEFGNDEDIPDA